MKKILLAAPLLVMLATPAAATGGLVCRTAGVRPLELSLVIGHSAISALVSAHLADGGRDVPVTIAQSWLDPNELRLDLVDRNAMRHEARVRVRRSGQVYDGSIWRGGERRWLRCREG